MKHSILITTLALACFATAISDADADIMQHAYLKASNTAPGDSLGESIAVSGTTMVVGAPQKAGGGSVYVFVRSGNNWIQQAELRGGNTESGDAFGCSVSISGDTIVVGADSEDGDSKGVNKSGSTNLAADSGAAYVFTRTNGVWTQQAYLKASNTGAGDHFGFSVTTSDDLVVIGATAEDNAATGINNYVSELYDVLVSSGAAYVFARTGTTWTQQAYLKASNTGAHDLFGRSVAAYGNTVVVGAPGEASKATGVNGVQGDYTNYTNAGAAYVFFRNGSVWSQQAYLKASNTVADAYSFGASVSISGDDIIVGAPDEGSEWGAVYSQSGAAYTFSRSGSTWTPGAYLKASNMQRYDEFGGSVAISGNQAVVGARLEDSSATGLDGNQADNLAGSSGAVYLFERINGSWNQQHYIKASNTGVGDQFGCAVAMSGDLIAIGASGEDSAATGVNGNQGDDSAAIAGCAYAFSPPVTYSLSASGGFGTVTGGGEHAAGATATVTASPYLGYLFTGWTGDASGSSNPLQLLMDSDKTVTATFQQDLADSDHDGLSNYQELAIHGTNPALVDSDNDGVDDKAELDKGLSPTLADSDGDGSNDGAEIEFGSDPLNTLVTAPFQARIHAFNPSTGCVIRFTSAAGESYQIESTVDLKTWTVVESGIAGQGNVLERTYPAAPASTKYYRVLKNPADGQCVSMPEDHRISPGKQNPIPKPTGLSIEMPP